MTMIQLTNPSQALAPDLPSRINAAHAACEKAVRSGLEHAITAGQLLAEAKAKQHHGEWVEWLETNCPDVSVRTAQRYMQISEQTEAFSKEARRCVDCHTPVTAANAGVPGDTGMVYTMCYWCRDHRGETHCDDCGKPLADGEEICCAACIDEAA